MKVSLEYELFSFLVSQVLAILIGLIYDLFRAMRNHTKKAVLLDGLMWILISVLVGLAWFFPLEGQLRWYTVFGTFFMGVIYFLTLSRYAYFFFRFLVDKICFIFGVFFKILLTPSRFLCRIICVYILRVKSKFSKKVEEKYDEKTT